MQQLIYFLLCTCLSYFASTNSDPTLPVLLLTLSTFAACLAFVPSPRLHLFAILLFLYVPDLTELNSRGNGEQEV